MGPTRCIQTLLADSACAQPSRCSCGHLYLALGPVTVRLEEPVLAELLTLLRQGAPALGQGGGWRQ